MTDRWCHSPEDPPLTVRSANQNPDVVFMLVFFSIFLMTRVLKLIDLLTQMTIILLFNLKKLNHSLN